MDPSKSQCSRWLRLVPSAAGMHLTATVAPSAVVDIAAVVRRAEARGVAVRALADFHLATPVLDGLVLGYGGITTARIDEGLALLAGACAARTGGARVRQDGAGMKS